jgi:hypothetical protein
MCLPVSRLFWVSSLAYPNLLGTKGYVVVVVVVVVLPPTLTQLLYNRSFQNHETLHYGLK